MSAYNLNLHIYKGDLFIKGTFQFPLVTMSIMLLTFYHMTNQVVENIACISG